MDINKNNQNTKYCPNCGKLVDSHLTECPFCGIVFSSFVDFKPLNEKQTPKNVILKISNQLKDNEIDYETKFKTLGKVYKYNLFDLAYYKSNNSTDKELLLKLFQNKINSKLTQNKYNQTNKFTTYNMLFVFGIIAVSLIILLLFISPVIG